MSAAPCNMNATWEAISAPASWSFWMQTQDGGVRRGHLGALISESGCKRSATNEYLMDCGNCWANQRVRICTWPLELDPPPGVPSELPAAGEVYVSPPPPPPHPASPSEQRRSEQMNELNEKMDR